MASPSSANFGLLDQGRQVTVRVALLGLKPFDQRRDSAAVGRGHLVVECVKRGDCDVPVPPLAKGVGEPLHLAQSLGIRLRREAGLEDLERGAQPPGRHTHVVDALDVAGVEHPLSVLGELARPHRDDPRGNLRIGVFGAQVGDRLGLGHGATA